jgi:hypothetical protein
MAMMTKMTMIMIPISESGFLTSCRIINLQSVIVLLLLI